MKLDSLLTVNAVVATLFGIAFVVAPAEILALYALTVTPGTAVVSRLFGAALIGYGLLTWGARGAAPSGTLRAIVRMLFVSEAIGFVVALHGQLSASVNALGWSTVVIYGGLAAGFAYFYFQKPGGAATS